MRSTNRRYFENTISRVWFDRRDARHTCLTILSSSGISNSSSVDTQVRPPSRPGTAEVATLRKGQDEPLKRVPCETVTKEAFSDASIATTVSADNVFAGAAEVVSFLDNRRPVP
jgi:hypothetical protein